MNRLGIMIIYDSQGIISNADLYLLRELCSVTNRIFVCLNGKNYQNIEVLQDYTSDIVIRDNIGFDGGAVKDVLLNYLAENELKEYNELVVCNNSFFGPFIPMEKIFTKMEKEDCDYWGFAGDDKDYASLIAGIGSYFLVFREKIIQDNALIEYFREYIDEKTESFNEIIATYEVGLNNYLLKKYKMSSYMCMNHLNIFEAGDVAMMKYGLPILKRKFFVERRTSYERMLNALRYIGCTEYDTSYISEKIKRIYGIDVWNDNEKYNLPIINESKYPTIRIRASEQDIQDFFEKHDKVYVYGTGLYGSFIWGVYAKEYDSLAGFVKTDKKGEDTFHKYPVYNISELPNDVAILVALNEELAKEVSVFLTERDVLYL